MRKVLAWIPIIVGSALFLLGVYMFSYPFLVPAASDKSFQIEWIGGLIVIIFSLLSFSVGALVLNFKGATIYKIILLVTIVLLILLFMSGGI